MFRYGIRVVLLGLLCVGLAGCGGSGPRLTAVKGKVSYKGQAVDKATVTFSSDEGLAVGMTDEKGEYKLVTGVSPGAREGKYKVTIRKVAQAPGAKEGMKPDDMREAYMKKMAKSGGAGAVADKSEIPTKYAAPQTSGLERTVTGDASKNVFDFELVD